ncbi:MAG: hypothetical protein WBV36_03165 [Terriglobales bacterium]
MRVANAVHKGIITIEGASTAVARDMGWPPARCDKYALAAPKSGNAASQIN